VKLREYQQRALAKVARSKCAALASVENEAKKGGKA
jgi:hypothetical protein